MKLENLSRGYDSPAGDASELLDRWEREVLTSHDRRVKRFFGSAFLFECGRIYGIQQERARRRAKQNGQQAAQPRENEEG